MTLILEKLNESFNADIYEMLQEMPYDENGFINSMNGKPPMEFSSWLLACKRDSEQKEVTDGWKVPQTTYWLFADGKPIGFGKIRHFLTEKLLQDGGNIGYSIRPSERNKGYGKQLLRLLLLECKKLNILDALLTIQKDNIASRKVALANNGIIKKETETLCYIWIDCV